MARRHFIDTQLEPVVQAFGYQGGWGVERRPGAKKKGKLAELRALAAKIPPWPCAGPGCTRMIQVAAREGRPSAASEIPQVLQQAVPATGKLSPLEARAQ